MIPLDYIEKFQDVVDHLFTRIKHLSTMLVEIAKSLVPAKSSSSVTIVETTQAKLTKLE